MYERLPRFPTIDSNVGLNHSVRAENLVSSPHAAIKHYF